jgi:general secretion pathway protein A
VAGSDGRIQWTNGALLLIRRYSRGVPRLVNVICDKALTAGYVAESFTIDAGLVQRAIEDIEGSPVAEEFKIGAEAAVE